MKILFVNPVCLDQRIAGEDAGVVPIGVYYMAALLRDKGFDARILNLADRGSSEDAVQTFRTMIQKEKPDLVGFSVTNPTRINAAACAREASALLPQAWIVAGGPAPTFMPAHLFKVCPEIDIMVQGEGEATILSLVTALAKAKSLAPEALETRSLHKVSLPYAWLKKIKGIAFLENGTLIETEPAEPIQDLDTLTHPSTYFNYQHLSMSRGCPGKCTFCGSPKFWGNACIRRHSALWFAEELLALSQKGVTHFYISDDTFTMDRERVIEFCKIIISAGPDITWNAISRVDYIDKELLFWMRRAGCLQISFGVESGAQAIKKRLGKPVSNAACLKAFTLTRSHGILPRAYFIYGSPGETDKTIQDSCDLMMQLKPLATVFYMLVIFPGTHLYDHARRQGLVTDDIWHQKIEDLPWFELDNTLDFQGVCAFGDSLRQTFFENLPQFARTLDLVDKQELYPFHADFLSRLAMTFSHGEYAKNPRIKETDETAEYLFKRALSYSPHPRAFMGMALLHQKQKKFDQAKICLARGLDHFPGNKDLSVCMGVCLMNQAQFKDALTFFAPFKEEPGIPHYIHICNSREHTP